MRIELRNRIYEGFGSQADFALALGIDESVVSRVIRERRRLTEEQKKKWASVLGCKPEEIFQENQR